MRSGRGWAVWPLLVITAVIGGTTVWVNVVPEDGPADSVSSGGARIAAGAPVACVAGKPERCFPGADLGTARRDLEAGGARCAWNVDGFPLACSVEEPTHSAVVMVAAARQPPNRVAGVTVLASVGGSGGKETERLLRQRLDSALRQVLRAFLPADVAPVLAEHAGRVDCLPLGLGEVVPPGYRVSCERPHPTPPTWTASVSLDAHA